MVILCGVLGSALAIAWSLTRPSTYSATAQLLLSPRLTTTQTDTNAQGTFVQSRIASYLHLGSTPYVLQAVGKDVNMSAADVAGKLTLSNPENTTVLVIQATDSDASSVVKIADSEQTHLAASITALETPAGSSKSEVVVTPIQNAADNTVTIKPPLKSTAVLWGITGLILGVIAALLRSAYDTKIRTTADLRRATDVAQIGAIPLDSRGKDSLVALHGLQNVLGGNAFHALRVNIQFLQSTLGNIFVVTSCERFDGRTTVAANLAIALAEAGKNTVLIDADLHEAAIARSLRLSEDPGLTDVLMGDCTLADAVRPSGVAKLSVLTSGELPENPNELLGSSQMSEVLASCASSYDFVVVDSPPLLSVADAVALTGASATALVVVEANKTSRPQLSRALDSLTTAGAVPGGIILNKISRKDSGAPDQSRSSARTARQRRQRAETSKS
ncbi:hypothetical protein AZH51_13860 [Branchiibius sp. NY16-3462-2]|nr:hypothetical protein AZH51_13860 [Branchiibius sp. NY16-3462-2]